MVLAFIRPSKLDGLTGLLSTGDKPADLLGRGVLLGWVTFSDPAGETLPQRNLERREEARFIAIDVLCNEPIAAVGFSIWIEAMTQVRHNAPAGGLAGSAP